MQQRRHTSESGDQREQHYCEREPSRRAVAVPEPGHRDRDAEQDECRCVDVLHEGDYFVHRDSGDPERPQVRHL